MIKHAWFVGILIGALHVCGSSEDRVYNTSVRSSVLLKTDTTTTGQKLSACFSNPSEITGLKVRIPPSQETGWQKHTVPGVAYVIKGKLTVDIDNGKSFEFAQGQSFAEVVDTYHNGKNKGSDTVELIAFFIGPKDTTITIKREVDKKK